MDFKKLLSDQSGVKIFQPKTRKCEIEYKKIDAKRFKNRGYQVESVEIDTDERYLTDELLDTIDLNSSDTTIINVGIGEGKTYTAYKLIKQYVDKGYKVISASPFVGLTERDFEALSNDVTVAHYHEIGEQDTDELTEKDVQIITINSLLGNPGDYDQPSYKKTDYLITLREYCEKNNQKVVFFFDEIHAGVENFISEYRDKLYHWKALTHKCFILSASYVEASYPVLGFISELTNKKVFIINSKRRLHESHSRLHLLFTHKRYSRSYLEPLNIIIPILKEASKRGKTINVLTAHKSLADELTDKTSDEDISKFISSLNPNLLTGDTSSDNKFEKGEINVGTAFGTGISIDEKDALYIIILPAYLSDKKNIFADGRSAIIQAIGRQRQDGDIVIISSLPKTMIEGEYLSNWPDDIQPERKYPYLPLSKQRSLLKEDFEEKKSALKHDSKIAGVQLTIDGLEYQIKEGQKVLGKYPIYGKSVIPYIIWASMNNQFQNALLKNIIYFDPSFSKYEVKVYKTNSNSLDTDLTKILSKNICLRIKELSDREAYDEIVKDLKFTYPEKFQYSTERVEPKKNKILYNGNEINHSQLDKHSAVGGWTLNKIYECRYGKIINYDLLRYINDQIYHSMTDNSDSTDYSTRLRAGYIRLGNIKTRLQGISNGNKNRLHYNLLDRSIIDETCLVHHRLHTDDFFIKNNIFSFLRTLDNSYKIGKQGVHIFPEEEELKEKIFRQLVPIFFETKDTRPTIDGNRKRMKEVLGHISASDNALNFLS